MYGHTHAVPLVSTTIIVIIKKVLGAKNTNWPAIFCRQVVCKYFVTDDGRTNGCKSVACTRQRREAVAATSEISGSNKMRFVRQFVPRREGEPETVDEPEIKKKQSRFIFQNSSVVYCEI